MKSLARSCRNWALVYFAIAALAGALVYERFPDLKVAAIGGLAGGFFVWMSIGYVFGIGTKRKEADIIRRGLSSERPVDGEKIAVVGTIAPSMDLLEAPITKKRCLAYEYKALAPDAQEYGIIQGFALAPLTINGRSGPIRLFAAPDLEFKDPPLGSREHHQNFREYVARTNFTKRHMTDIRSELAELKKILADDDGRIRYDIRRDDERSDLSMLTLTEKTLAPGDEVVAIGRYSATRGALVPDESAMLYPVKISKGPPEEAMRKTKRSGAETFLSCGCLLPVVIAAIAAMAMLPLSAIEQRFPEKDPSWIEVQLETKLRKELIQRGLPHDEGDYAVVLEPGEARGKVRIGDRTGYLRRATATGVEGGADVTLSGDATNVIVYVRNRQLDSVRIGDRVVPAADISAEAFGADDDGASGRITYVAPGDGPMLRVMFRAQIPR